MKRKESAPRLSYQCPKLWETLSGSETERFCEACGHNVYNFSELSRSERKALIEKSKMERVCVTYAQNLDGELLEMPLAERKNRTAVRIAAVAAGAIALSSCSSKKNDSEIITMGIMCPPEESK